MRNKFITLAFAAGAGTLSSIAGAADAPGSVTFYGIIDAGFVHETGGAKGTLDKITSGANSMSRIGWRGNEDLGGGTSAIFGLESGIRIDSGEMDVPGSVFNRFAFVGLRSLDYGTLTLGRQYTPWYTTLFTMADPFGTSLPGNVKNLFPIAGNASRTSNMVLYVSPSMHGASVELAYTLGEQAGSDSAGRQLGMALVYQKGPLHLRAAYNNRNNDTAAVPASQGVPAVPGVSRGIATNTLFAGNYDFGFLKAYLAYGIDRGEGSGALLSANPYGTVPAPTPSTDARDMVIGFNAPFGPGRLIASHVRKDDRTRFDQDARQWGVGYQYPLSVRTLLYVSYARIHNHNGAGYIVGNGGEVGSGDSSFTTGLRLTF